MNPFDQLVLDEPPLRLDVDVIVDRGRAQVRRRRIRARAGMAVVALGMAVAVPAALRSIGPDRLPAEQQQVASPPAVPPITGPSQRDGVLPAVAGVKAPAASKIDRTDDFGLLTLGPSANDVLVDVDRVDMLGGDEAEAAARARGDEVSNDYYLVNDNPQLRRYRLSPAAVVWGSIRLAGSVEHTRMQVEDLLSFLRSDASTQVGTLFHFEIDDGEIVAVEEQYRP